MTFAEFKRLDVYKTANTIDIIDEKGNNIEDSVSEEELNGMDVKGYYVDDGFLTVELCESVAEFE